MSGPALRLAVTMGDPRGIGPEIAAAARAQARVPLVLVGPTGAGTPPDLAVGQWEGGAPAQAGALAAEAIRTAVRLALDGEVAGIVTAPIDKAALAAAGIPFPGHTEMLQSLTDAPDVGMLMAAERTRLGGPLRVLLATTHIALEDVPAAVTRDRIVSRSRLLATGLRDDWGIQRPRIAICALNPHASDGGLFGDQEARVLVPAVSELADEGLDVAGPVPADTVFLRALRGEFDAVVAPYHDVGMAAFKTASFGSGVNVTLGLPFPRTSPDHGTALDIAGQGRADPSSMIEAVLLAARLAELRQTARA